MQAESYIYPNDPYSWCMPQGRPTDTERPKLGERIARARQQAGLTQIQLAKKLGVTQRIVTYWEREAAGLRADQLASLAEVLGVSSEYFLGREQKARGKGPTGKAHQIFEQVSQLPRSQQQRILSTVEDMLIARQARSS